MTSKAPKSYEEHLIFLKQMIKNPRGLGALFPSSEALGDFIAQSLVAEKSNSLSNLQAVVEVGGGTGRLTASLLKSGIAPEKIYVIELDPTLVQYLKKILPENINILQGNANNLAQLLPAEIVGQVDAIVSGLPMMNISFAQQEKLIASFLEVLKKNGKILQFTYGITSPLPAENLGLAKEKVGYVFKNFPPATLWKFWRNN